MATYKLSLDADRDVAQIFLDGLEMFGAAQAEKYALGMSGHFAFLAEKKKRGSDYSYVLSGLCERIAERNREGLAAGCSA